MNLITHRQATQYLAAGLLFACTNAVAGPTFTEKPITDVGWNVSYLGSTYDSDSQTTTFFYQLDAATSEKDLSHWVLALGDQPTSSEGCTLVKFGLDPTTGVSGWKCDDGQSAGTSQQYTITVSGHIGEATTSYSVKGGTYYAVGTTTGPGTPIVDAQTYDISGIAYLDANGNGLYDAGEPTLSNVTLQLSNGQSTTTSLTGAYVFNNLTSGGYTISIPSQTDNVIGDFNETLTQYFQPTNSSELSVSVGPSAQDENFGFNPNLQALVDDFDSSDPDGDEFTFSGTGKTIGFWKHQVTSARQGKTKGVQVSAASIKDYLYNGSLSIKTLFIDVFGDIPASTPGAYDYALAVLSSTSSNAIDLLKKQLFGTELNHIAGLGLTDSQLQGVLLAWSEYLVKNAASFGREQLLAAQYLCDQINNTGE